MKHLVLGGVRSGKSRLAEQLARNCGLPVTYIATAKGGDPEMQRRIEAHKAHRDPAWNLVEEPVTLAAVLAEHATPYRCLLVDCLTLWLTNLLGTEDDTVLRQEIEALKASFSSLPGEIILVSNEINMGVIPLGALTRRFCDELGVLHQLLAAECDRVVLMVAGLPLLLKGG